MIPRGKLDISFFTLFRGIIYCVSEILGIKYSENIRAEDNTLNCLSVRTGLDLTLRALNLEPGSEILVTNINIPDMFSILSAHQLVAIPLAVNKNSLEFSKQDIEALITPATKAIMITHLFGGIMNIGNIVKLAKDRGLIVLEDCAQAFNGTYVGSPLSDTVMFSFGLIKTNTTLTGAILRYNNTKLYDKVVALNDQLPMQSTSLYLKKIFKALAIKTITLKWIFTLLYHFTKSSKRDFDDVLASFTRGFPGTDVISKIRYRPCQANLRLMTDRVSNFSINSIDKRKQLALLILENIPDAMKIGNLNIHHTYWVIAIESQEPERLIRALRLQGCDATTKASSLIKLKAATESFNNDELDLDKLVYLPINKATSKKVKAILKPVNKN